MAFYDAYRRARQILAAPWAFWPKTRDHQYREISERPSEAPKLRAAMFAAREQVRAIPSYWDRRIRGGDPDRKRK